MKLFVTDRLEDLFALQGLNLIIELTGVVALQNEIYSKRPAGVSVMDHKAARLLWDLIQIEAKKTDLEKEHQILEQRSRSTPNSSSTPFLIGSWSSPWIW